MTMKLPLAVLATSVAVTFAVTHGPALGVDRYPGFEARYVESEAQTLFAVTAEELATGHSGDDVTSCLYRGRKGLIDLLARAKQPEAFNVSRVRLYLREDKGTWAVDDAGVVRHHGRDFALSDTDYRKFRLALFLGLPKNESASSLDPIRPRYKNAETEDYSREHNYIPAKGYVPDAATATGVGYAVLVAVYGKEQIDGQCPLKANLDKDVWVVQGDKRSLPGRGGLALVRISKNKGAILRMTHGK